MRARSGLLVLFSSLALAVVGCGHPASVQECEQIVERIAQLELEKRGIDPQAIATEVKTTKQQMHERTMKECVGRRITESALRCVRDAKRSEQIEQCFN
jgi:small lipoprotein (TIGR04454 family)